MDTNPLENTTWPLLELDLVFQVVFVIDLATTASLSSHDKHSKDK